MMVTGNNYVVPFTISLHDIFTPISQAAKLTQHIVTQIYNAKSQNVITDMIHTHVRELKIKFKELDYSLHDFLRHITGKDIFTHSRTERGAINAVGTLANALFGTATQKQVDEIHHRLNELESLTEQERKMLNIHSKTLNITLTEMTTIHKAIHKLQQATRISENLLNTMHLEVQNNEQALMTLETLLHVQLTISSIADEHLKIKIGLEDMMKTHLSPNIITNEYLIELLKEISEETTGLLFPPSNEFLGLHRNVIRVAHVNDKVESNAVISRLNFYLLVPLRGNPADTFEVFGMAPLPYPIPQSNYFMLHYPSTRYFVISESRTLYFLADNVDVCRRHEKLLICPPFGPIYNINIESCESAIFLQRKTASSLCKKIITKNFPPVFIKNNQGYSFATSYPLDISLTCTNKKTERHVLKGTGNIQIGQGCSMHSHTFILPEYSTNMETEPIAITPYPFATMPLTFTEWEHQFLVNSTNITLPNSDLKAIPLQDYIQQLQPLVKPPSTPESKLPEWLRFLLLTGGIILMLGVLTGGWVLRSRLTKHKLCGPTPSSEEEVEMDGVPLEDHDIPGQAPPPQGPTCPHRSAQRRALEGGSMS